ncbi:MAG: hypothetical protein CMI85_03320 [Candidatus Pelagibacter sp.]|nr:hypothetical protein [Candidatus Pelagibacter sp.]
MKLTKPRETIAHKQRHIILLMACYALGGSKNSIHTEDIMNQAFLWNRDKFGWRKQKYKNYPNTLPLSQGLFRARTYGFLKGTYDQQYLSKDGWTLTDKGLEKAESLSSLINVKTSKKTLSQFQRKVLSEFRKHENFELDDKEFTIYHLADVLNISVNNLPLLNSTIIKIFRWAKISDDKEVLNLISKKIKKQKGFKKYLKEVFTEI